MVLTDKFRPHWASHIYIYTDIRSVRPSIAILPPHSCGLEALHFRRHSCIARYFFRPSQTLGVSGTTQGEVPPVIGRFFFFAAGPVCLKTYIRIRADYQCPILTFYSLTSTNSFLHRNKHTTSSFSVCLDVLGCSHPNGPGSNVPRPPPWGAHKS